MTPLLLILLLGFTPEISIPFGSAGYDGLRRLVLEAQIGGLYFAASKIEINPDDLITDKSLNGRRVSSKDYDMIVQKAIENKHD